jgi:hypothetical protein
MSPDSDCVSLHIFYVSPHSAYSGAGAIYEPLKSYDVI